MILIVDDSADLTDIYANVIKHQQLNWKVFQNGYEALDFINSNPEVEAVVLDLAMPNVDGLQITEEIRRNEQLHGDRKAIKIAYLTAYNKTEPIERIMDKNDVEKYFVKPKAPQELFEEIKDWLEEDKK